jgi:RNA polymerase sigma-70 factor (ECF subfamily)
MGMKLNEGMNCEETKLMDKHQTMVRKAALKYLGKNYANWVDDITQDVMLKVLTNFDKFEEKKGSIESWIYTMTRNLCFDLMAKKANSLKKIEMNDSFVLYADEENLLEYKELKKIIRTGLDQLTEIDRTLLVMRFYIDMRGREIAEKLNIPENQIPPRIMRAKVRLRNYLIRFL